MLLRTLQAVFAYIVLFFAKKEREKLRFDGKVEKSQRLNNVRR